MRPLGHIPEFPHFVHLPEDKTVECRLKVGSVKLPGPINGKPQSLEREFARSCVVLCHVSRIIKLVELLTRDPVNINKFVDHRLVSLCKAFCCCYNGLPSPMPCEGKENVISLHSLESRISIDSSISKTVANVEGTVHVREWDC